ncbi:hypothetical protein GOBAR_DD04483 [Gossypium barbadense]|nr:hypothetical protein GOBAR_DD04483 [Gossypium barbadense]
MCNPKKIGGYRTSLEWNIRLNRGSTSSLRLVARVMDDEAPRKWFLGSKQILEVVMVRCHVIIFRHLVVVNCFLLAPFLFRVLFLRIFIIRPR